jgi:acetyltransferase-like isoleucine patch superfamily enzyme
MNKVSEKASIGFNLVLGHNVIIGDNAVIGDNVTIGHNGIVDNCIIKDNVTVHENCILGYRHATGWVSRTTDPHDLVFDRLEIGNGCTNGCTIREGCTLYVGAKLASGVKIHHKVLVREKTIIGTNTSIGSMCDLEGNLVIGNNCSIHSNVHLCYDTTIGDYVFIAPFTVTTNGNPMSYKRPALYEKFGFEKGPVIESGCQIAVHVTILPRVRIGHESMIGANSLVTRDVEPLSIMLGSPAKHKGIVEEIYRLPLEIRTQLGLGN